MAVACLYGFTDIRLTDIELAMLRQDFEASFRLAKEFVLKSGNPEDVDYAYYYSGLSQLKRGRHAQARDIFHKLVKATPDKSLIIRANLALMDSYYIQEYYEEVLEISANLQTAYPQSDYEGMILYKSARAHLKLAHWQRARELFNQILKSFPGSFEAQMAEQFLQEKQFFAVQVGSFLERRRAEDQMTELKRMGEYAYIVETMDQNNNQFYRVRVGQLAGLKEAQKLKTKLSGMGYPTLIYP
jgi:tetratricopeptide (TPR) repeat protein